MTLTDVADLPMQRWWQLRRFVDWRLGLGEAGTDYDAEGWDDADG